MSRQGLADTRSLWPRRVLITGASGFIGANLARRMIEDGHAVSLLLRPGYQHWRLDGVGGRFTPHQADLRDRGSVEAALAAVRPEWIFHLATYGAYPGRSDLDIAFDTNVVATLSMLQAALRHGVGSVVIAGTSSEYGAKDHAPPETEWLDPTTAYGATKAAATLLCRQLARAEGANVAILRLYSTYGPFEEPTRLIPAIIAESWRNRWPRLANPEVAHDFVYVDDVVEAFVRAAAVQNEPGAVYNVATGIQTSLREVVDAARAVLKVTTEPRWGSLPDRPWDTHVWFGDSQRLRDATGWEPQLSFRDGLSRFAEWFDREPGLRTKYAAARGTGVG